MLTSSFSNSEDLLMNSISSVSTSTYAFSVYLAACLHACLPANLSTSLPACPFVCLPAWLAGWLADGRTDGQTNWLMTHPFALPLLFLPLSFYTILFPCNYHLLIIFSHTFYSSTLFNSYQIFIFTYLLVVGRITRYISAYITTVILIFILFSSLHAYLLPLIYTIYFIYFSNPNSSQYSFSFST